VAVSAAPLKKKKIMKKMVEIHVDWDRNFCACPMNDTVCCAVVGDSITEIKADMEESLPMHVECMQRNGDTVPEEFLGEYELKYVLTPQALLKSMQGVLTQTALSRTSGIKPQQLSYYATGKRRPRAAQRTRIVEGIHSLARELMAVE
jgi:predicted RNase H-like HicB family nuclease